MLQNSNLSLEQYLLLKKNNEFGKLNLHKDTTQYNLRRNALIDYLVNDFHWDYWCVVTCGYHPSKSLGDEILYTAHHKFDRWLLTNRKLSHMTIEDRSKWVCIPERGSDGHLHFNCYIQLGIRPTVTHIGKDGRYSEFLTVKECMKRTIEAINKQFASGSNYGDKINGRCHFTIHERKYHIDKVRQSVYSTKEMTAKNEHEDHFAEVIYSWKDWVVAPMNRRTPKKLKHRPHPSATLDEFMN